MKQYLVKKDVNKPNAENNWIVMNGYEFSCFLQTKEGERRKKNFATLDDGECHTRDIVVECDESEAKRIERERQCAYRRKKARYSIRILSLNHPSPLLGPSTFEEDVSGNLADVEQAALKNIRKQLLFDAIKTLSPLQQELLWEVFLSPKPISLTEYAVKNNILCSSACERKRRAFATIKKFLEKHGITSEEFD